MGSQQGIVAEDTDLVQLYLNDIARHPLLTKDDEVRLGRAVQAGLAARAELAQAPGPEPHRRAKLEARVRAGAEAADAFVTSNLRLVVSVAKRYAGSGMSLLDLVQEGNCGLMHAVEKFDPEKGFKFSTYATWWIRQAIGRGIANTGRTLRLPVHAREQLLALRMENAAFEARHGRRPCADELAGASRLPLRKVNELLPFLDDAVSLSQRSADGGRELAEVVVDDGAWGPDEQVLASLVPAQVAQLLSCLDFREREILCLRYGLDQGRPRTLREVGEQFGLTREGVRHIENRAMFKLRQRCARGDQVPVSA